MPIDLEKYKKLPTQTPSNSGGVDISKYRKTPVSFKYPEVQTAESQQQKISKYQEEARQSEAVSKKANSFGGMLGNFGKAFVGTVANSEVGLGESISKIIQAGSKVNLKSQSDNITAQNNLNSLIRQKKARGEDTSTLERMYNNTVSHTESLNKNIKEEVSLPSTQKVLGQLGGTALDVLTAGTYGKAAQGMKTGQLASKIPLVRGVATATGAPELGQMAARKASGIGTWKGIGNIAKGAGAGYAVDVTQGLQGARGENREGGKAFIPGMGTALGSTLPIISEAGQTIANKFDPQTKGDLLITRRHKELEKLDAYKTLKTATEKGRERGIDVKKVLAETDVLHGSVDNRGTINTKGDGGAIEQYTRQFIDGNEKLVSEALKKEGVSISPDVIRLKLEKAVMDAGIEGKALVQAKKSIADELSGYALRSSDNGVIPVSTLHDAKIDKYNSINFFTEGNTKKYDKTIAKALKELVETNTKSVDVSEVNKELSRHFAVIDYLNRLDGKKVEGGKLGKYFAQSVGAIVGSHFGPLGAIVGATVGGGIKGNLMSRAFGGQTGRTIPTAESIKDAVKFKDAKPLELPPAQGIINSTQTPNPIKPTNNNAPRNINPLTAKTAGDISNSSAYTKPAMNKTQNTPAPMSKNGIPTKIPLIKKKSNKGLGTLLKSKLPENLKNNFDEFTRDKNLSPQDAEIQEKSIGKYLEKKNELLQETLKTNGKIANTDEQRKFFKDIGYNGANSAAVQEAASQLNKDQWRHLLKNNSEPDAVLYAGGSGSGKTSIVGKLMPDIEDTASAVLDGNLSTYSSAKKRIAEAKEAGKNLKFIYVYREPVDAWVNGVIARMLNNAKEGGRVVPLSVFTENHKGSYDVIKKLKAEYGDDVTTLDNSLGSGNEEFMSLDKFNSIQYSDIKSNLLTATKQLLENGTINKKQYDALVK